MAVLVAAISPYRHARDQVRAQVDTFVEVHVAAPVATCAHRDPKGLYAKARAGELPHFAGISDPYEPPLTPELVLHTDTETVDESVHHLLGWLQAHQLTTPNDPLTCPTTTAAWSTCTPTSSPATAATTTPRPRGAGVLA